MIPGLQSDATQEGRFASTRWTVVIAAGESGFSSGHGFDALSELCRIYWRPLYLFLRREGIGAEDAQDLTQGFFAELIRDRVYLRADREKGRFRSFLLGALKHFVWEMRDREHAQKRGGGKIREPLDERAIAEVEAQVASTKNWAADSLYDREWAAALLRQTLDRLGRECVIAGKTGLFDCFQPYLSTARDKTIPYDEISRQLNRNIGTLRNDLARLRSRYRAILREEVCGTIAEPTEVDEELRYLCRVIAQA